MTVDQLAALVEEALEANGVSLGQRSRYAAVAARLRAAGVTVEPADEVTSEDFAVESPLHPDTISAMFLVLSHAGFRVVRG